MITLWWNDDDGFQHCRRGRFYMRRNPALIARMKAVLEARHLQEDEVSYDG
jgi:hypothetical protein